MKVIVGKADPSTQTPMLASTIYYATLNPYWHVIGRDGPLADRPERARPGPRLSRSRTATRCWPPTVRARCSIRPRSTGTRSPPAAKRSGCASCRDRATRWAGSSSASPTPPTSISTTRPTRTCSRRTTATLSHGCIRLEDAERLGRWLMGRDPQAASTRPGTECAAADAGADLRHLPDRAGRRRAARASSTTSTAATRRSRRCASAALDSCRASASRRSDRHFVHRRELGLGIPLALNCSVSSALRAASCSPSASMSSSALRACANTPPRLLLFLDMVLDLFGQHLDLGVEKFVARRRSFASISAISSLAASCST